MLAHINASRSPKRARPARALRRKTLANSEGYIESPTARLARFGARFVLAVETEEHLDNPRIHRSESFFEFKRDPAVGLTDARLKGACDKDATRTKMQRGE